MIETFLWCNYLGHVDAVGSVNNKAERLGMEHIKGKKFTEKKEKESRRNSAD